MSIEESKPNMRLIIASAAIGALVAGVGFYLMKRYRCFDMMYHQSVITNFCAEENVWSMIMLIQLRS